MHRPSAPSSPGARRKDWLRARIARAATLCLPILSGCGDGSSGPGDTALARAEGLLVAAERFEGRGATTPGLAFRYAAAVALAGAGSAEIDVVGDVTGRVSAVALQLVDITGSGATEDTTATNWLVAYQDTAAVMWAFGQFGSGDFNLLTAAGGIFQAPAALWEAYEGAVEYSGMALGVECGLTAAREAALVRALDRAQAGITVGCRRATFNGYLKVEASDPVNVFWNTATGSRRVEFQPANTLLPGARLEIRHAQ